jgi:putative addiction module component (TIGR02574 family)
MSGEAETIYNAALALPFEEREQLVHRLRQSIESDAEVPTAAEEAEIERRLEEVRSGKVKTIPAEEAYAAVLQRLRDGKRT